MDASLFFLTAGICVTCLMAGMTLYPLLQAFRVIECHCDKNPNDKWTEFESERT